MAYLHYLFPKTYIEGVSSRRQRGERLIHFVYSTLIYLGLLYALFVVARDRGPQTTPAEMVGEGQVAEDSLGHLETPQAAAALAPAVDPSTADDAAAIREGDGVQPVTPTAGFDPSPWAEHVQEALATSETQRWEIDGEKGYVLVSGPTVVNGQTCRNLSVSFDDGRIEPAGDYCQAAGGDWRRR